MAQASTQADTGAGTGADGRAGTAGRVARASRRRTVRAPRGPHGHSSDRPRRSVLLTVLTALVAVYTLVPLAWLLISATKTQKSLLDSFGLWFSGDFALWDNIQQTLTYNDHIFVRWLLNTLLYVALGAGGATFLAVLGGYGLAKFDFPGRRGSSRW